MSRLVYVLGRDAEEAEDWIRQQNVVYRWKPDVEFVTVTRVDQVWKLGRFYIVTLPGFEHHPDRAQFELQLKRTGVTWEEAVIA